MEQLNFVKVRNMPRGSLSTLEELESRQEASSAILKRNAISQVVPSTPKVSKKQKTSSSVPAPSGEEKKKKSKKDSKHRDEHKSDRHK